MILGHLQRCLAYRQLLSKTVRTDTAGLQQQPACGQLSGADIFFPQTWPKFGPDLGEKTDRVCPPLVHAWPSVQRHRASPPLPSARLERICHPQVHSGRRPYLCGLFHHGLLVLRRPHRRPPQPPPPLPGSLGRSTGGGHEVHCPEGVRRKVCENQPTFLLFNK